MKLQTSIPARLDGTVLIETPEGSSFTFTANAQGDLEADVTDESVAAKLLASGNFWPADPADQDRALALAQAALPKPQAQDEEPEADDTTIEVTPGGLPDEANTPPAPTAKARTAKAAK